MTARSDDCVRSIPAFCRRGGLSAPPFSPSAADQVVKGLIEIIARPYTALRCEDLSVFFHTHLNPPLSWISLYDIAELTNDFFERFSLRNTKMYPRFIPAEVRCIYRSCAVSQTLLRVCAVPIRSCRGRNFSSRFRRRPVSIDFFNLGCQNFRLIVLSELKIPPDDDDAVVPEFLPYLS